LLTHLLPKMFSVDVEQNIRQFNPFHEKSLISNLFSWTELESLLNLRPFTNKKRFISVEDLRKEWIVSNHIKFNSAWLTDYDSYPPEVIKYFIHNSVCYLRDCSRVNKRINSICAELERLTLHPSDAHIYFCLTNNLESGFGPHWDQQHNLIVQVEGETHFRIWGKTTEWNSFRVSEPRESPLIDAIMKPGDSVFVPAHYVHCATSLMKRLSVSFPMTISRNELHQSRDWITLPM